MQDILDAIARRADLGATFKRLEAMIPGVSSEELRPVIAASLELAAALIRASRFRREVIAARLEDGYLDAI